MKNLFFIFSMFTSLSLFAEASFHKSFKIANLKEVSMEVPNGDVSIEAATGEEAHISVEKIEWDQQCKLEFERSEDELELEIDRDNTDKSCKVKLVAHLPATAELDLKVGTGKLIVLGWKGEIEFKAGSGDVEIVSDALEIDGMSGSGDVVLSGSMGDVELKAGSGSLKLSYMKVPAKAKLSLKTGSGDALVKLPKGSSFRSSFISPAGKLKTQLKEDANSDFKVKMLSGSGNLIITDN